MYAVVFGLAVVLVLYVVGRPLISPDAVLEGFWFEPSGQSDALEREKALAALAEVENDYQMNKLSAADYEELKARYTRRALALMQAPGVGHPRGTGRGARGAASGSTAAGRKARLVQADAEAEAEVMLVSLTEAVEAADAADAAEASGPSGASGMAQGRFCHCCGAALLRPGQRFCQTCGAAQEGMGS